MFDEENPYEPPDWWSLQEMLRFPQELEWRIPYDQQRGKSRLLHLVLRKLEREQRLRCLMKYASQPGLVLEPHSAFTPVRGSRHNGNAFMKGSITEPNRLEIGPLMRGKSDWHIFINDHAGY